MRARARFRCTVREVLLRRLDSASAEAEIAAAAALAGRVARERGRLAGALQIAVGDGDGVALGRWQAAHAGAPRRATGGHAAFAGRGTLGLTILLPGPAAWLDEALPSLDRLPNRMVRGLLAGLRANGYDASYPGRDVVRARGAAVALLGVERDALGVCWISARIGAAVSVAPPELGRWPGGARSPLAGATALGAPDAAALGDAIRDAYRRRHALAFVDAPPDAAERDAARAHAAAEPGAELPHVGPELEIPLGTLRAAVRARGNAVAAVAFRSEWLAASAGVAELERALAGAPLEADALRERIAPVLADARHFFLGYGSAETLIRAILEAAATPGSARSPATA
jgi:hypothetical protein